MVTSLLTSQDESAAAEVGRGPVKITCARVEGGKQLRGSCSITPAGESTPQEMLAGLKADCAIAAQVRTIAEGAGVSTDELLTHLLAEFPAAPDSDESAE